MNQNIEVINPGLWAVNYHYLRYIRDIDYLCFDPDAMDKAAAVSNEGIIILNKNHELYRTLKQFTQKIMENTDDELAMKISSMKDKNRDGYDRLYKFCLELEARRRMVKKQYDQQVKEVPIIKKIVSFIGKKVK